ncbi:MAG: bifunctional phosphoglucose/phosphomannose isomerase [Candidatus Lokiarchaeota archaeon]|nr:bifunctional phosphoglucose/phosphomannose isomerase [Candidatus Lokiarchaeota archaeon]
MLEKDEILKIDKLNMSKDIYRFPDYIIQARNNCKSIDYLSIKQIIESRESELFPNVCAICGMGGSAISGEILNDYLRMRVSFPIITVRNYTLPSYINKNSLVFIISYSGNTEETLSAFKEALNRGALIISITSNGKLKEFCKKLQIPFILVPSNLAPRAALGHLFTSLLISVQELGLIESVDDEISEMIEVLKIVRDEIAIKNPLENNIAKQTALKCVNNIPVIYITSAFQSIAKRYKTQFNENSKVPCKVDYFPELAHNEVVGWECAMEMSKNFICLLLRIDESEEIKTRIEMTKSIVLKEKLAEVIEIYSRGESNLSKILSLILVGDYISLYLAILNNKDPSSTESIDKLKTELKEQLSTVQNLENELFSKET